jgi:hypothetical protein
MRESPVGRAGVSGKAVAEHDEISGMAADSRSAFASCQGQELDWTQMGFNKVISGLAETAKQSPWNGCGFNGNELEAETQVTLTFKPCAAPRS